MIFLSFHDFPLIFLWFSYDRPVFLWPFYNLPIYYGLPMNLLSFQDFSMVIISFYDLRNLDILISPVFLFLFPNCSSLLMLFFSLFYFLRCFLFIPLPMLLLLEMMATMAETSIRELQVVLPTLAFLRLNAHAFDLSHMFLFISLFPGLVKYGSSYFPLLVPSGCLHFFFLFLPRL